MAKEGETGAKGGVCKSFSFCSSSAAMGFNGRCGVLGLTTEGDDLLESLFESFRCSGADGRAERVPVPGIFTEEWDGLATAGLASRLRRRVHQFTMVLDCIVVTTVGYSMGRVGVSEGAWHDS